MAFRANFCRLPATLIDVPSLDRIQCRKVFSVRCSSDSDFDPKVFRKNLTRGDNYNRKGFGRKEETLKLMNREYTSMLLCFFFDFGLSSVFDGNSAE
jgi:4-hydroxy-3-methylbut-2-en-1-yl diphosphate reductase